MKTKSTVRWTLNKIFFLLLITVVSILNLQAQNYPPMIQWNWTDHYDPTNIGGHEDWIYQLMQATDGNYIGAGYCEVSSIGGYWPSMEKVDAAGNLVWKNWYAFPTTAFGGIFYDISELTMSGQQK
ncbi:MAG: hypothetical protein JJE25_09525, partial [Bacteroidia bacterium]|nr:hypothetical protein [Bacteroidia bacterium]